MVDMVDKVGMAAADMVGTAVVGMVDIAAVVDRNCSLLVGLQSLKNTLQLAVDRIQSPLVGNGSEGDGSRANLDQVVGAE